MKKDTIKSLPSLALCILMDAAGMATYFFPLWGEFGDLLWAPISAFIFYKTFGGRTGLFGSVINFAEEILPFTDFFPTFSLAYLYRWVENKVSLKRPKEAKAG